MAAPLTPVDPGGPGGPGGPGPMPVPGVDFPVTIATPQHPDLAYATASPAQKLDLYLPDGPGPFPVVLIVHGGTFMFGDKSHQHQQGRHRSAPGQGLCRGQRQLPVERGSQGAGPNPGCQDRRALAARPRRGISPESGQDSAPGDPRRAATWWRCWEPPCGVAALEGAELGHADQSSRIQAVSRLVRPNRLPADGRAIPRYSLPCRTTTPPIRPSRSSSARRSRPGRTW